ncbi:uncharacterized protein LOC111391392 [Olea europaea var. sylvestris]|uniref:uncharacterized protein LOC111391392 n=1 Tax=Olea europaea var. sylvestris TaxID=158386 RepID=UPI000C1D1B1B|nr:uncharacterized protein LOC111391392 [Olea europaea var. sylvestris]
MEVYVDDMLVKSIQMNEQFLGYNVNQRGIEANLVNIRALLEMRSPQKLKEVQCLNGRIVALNRFISRATDKSLPFFEVLKQGKKFQWTDECEETFQALKKHLGEAPLLSKPKPQESLLIYLALSDKAVNAVIVREEDEHQLSVYYVSKALLPTENRYPGMENLALALITAHAIKGQALADFVAESPIALVMEAAMEPAEPPTWNLFVDRSTGETGFGVGIVLESPEGLRFAKEIQVKRLLASSDSQLTVSRVNGNFATKDSSMDAYLKLVLDLIPHFERFELIQVPRLENTHVDALSKLASSKDSELLKIVPIERLSKPSISEGEELLWIESTPVGMQPIMAYLKDQPLPASRSEKGKKPRIYSGRSLKGSAKITPEEWLWHTKQPSQILSVVTSLLPFVKWGIDFIGPLAKGRGSATFVIVPIDYFTKWVEAEPLAEITEANTTKFVWKNIICRFGISYSLVSDNGRQFGNKKMRDLCNELGIKKDFSTPHHPQEKWAS